MSVASLIGLPVNVLDGQPIDSNDPLDRATLDVLQRAHGSFFPHGSRCRFAVIRPLEWLPWDGGGEVADVHMPAWIDFPIGPDGRVILRTFEAVRAEIAAAFNMGEDIERQPRMTAAEVEQLRDREEFRRITAAFEQAFRSDMVHMLASCDSTRTGRFEDSSMLRDEDDDPTDSLGVDTDNSLGMGEAEAWFRGKRGE